MGREREREMLVNESATVASVYCVAIMRCCATMMCGFFG